MVEVKHITKRYGTRRAIADVSFTLKKGQIYGLLGPNGAGKSTTMNIMTGYIGASEGTVTIEGCDILKDAKKAKTHIGYLPELPPLYPDMTVHEYLMFVAQLKGIAKKDRLLTIEEIMDETQIVDVADRQIKNLSKGYRQRVGFAQAIIGEPELVILDEPTVGLDPKQILEFRELLKAYGKEHIVMISSHILTEIEEVCEHVFIISRGKLVADVDMDEVDGSLEEMFFALTDAEPETEDDDEDTGDGKDEVKGDDTAADETGDEDIAEAGEDEDTEAEDDTEEDIADGGDDTEDKDTDETTETEDETDGTDAAKEKGDEDK